MTEDSTVPTAVNMQRLLSPRVIAAVGASSGRERLSGRVIENLRRFGFDGKVIPVNPKRTDVAGLPTVARIGEIVEPVDVAFISVPAGAVEDSLREAAAAGTSFAVILTAGFEGEAGRVERESLEKCVAEVNAQGLRVLGPNCIGILNVSNRMLMRPAMFVRDMPEAGGVVVISQSGGLSLGVINEAAAWGIGLRSVIHTGNEIDLGLEDFLGQAAVDKECTSIAVSIEQIRRPEEFARHAQIAAASGKRLVYLKIGRSARGMQAAATHTGAVAGDADICDAFLRDLGFIRADTPQKLIQLADPIWPAAPDLGRAVGVVCISGGEAGLAADIADVARVALAQPSNFPRLGPKLGSMLGNPLDVTGRIYGEPELIEDAVLDLKDDASCGAVIVSFPPMSSEHLDQFTSSLKTINKQTKGSVAVICSVTSEDAFRSAKLLRNQGIAVFDSLQDAFEKFAAVSKSPVESETVESTHGDQDTRRAVHLSDVAADLAFNGLPLPRIGAVTSSRGLPAGMKFPVALKVEHPLVVHRAVVGLVELSLANEAELIRSFDTMAANVKFLKLQEPTFVVQEMASVIKPTELLVGYRKDAVFGDVLILGEGGVKAGQGDGRGQVRAYVQVTAPSIEAARAALNAAVEYEWLSGGLSEDAMTRLAEVVAGIWQVGPDWRFSEWEVNPLLVGEDGSPAIVDGVGFSL